MKNLSQLSLFLIIFICTSEIEACSCICIFPYPNIDSLFESSNLGAPLEPDAQLKAYINNHRAWFIGKIDSVIAITDNTERIAINIDTVLIGDVPFKSLSVVNIANTGNCIRSAKSFVNISFLGYMDSAVSPQNLYELGISAQACGIGVSGYFYKSGCLLRADVSESTIVINRKVTFSCSGPIISIFSIVSLFRVPIQPKENTLKSHFINTCTPLRYYSILGKKIAETEFVGNSIIISKRQRDRTLLFWHR
jgi:hypothetical protein